MAARTRPVHVRKLETMKTRKLRIGVAGLGRIGWDFHCQRLAAHADYTLAAVADPLPARVQEAESTFGCRGFATFAAMIAAGDLDIVVVATPTHLHRAMAEAAFSAGLHVILEKPMAPTATEARAIARAATKAGRKLTIYQPHRLAAYLQHLRALLADGRIGQVYHVRRGMFAYVRRDDWQSLRKFGGGMLNNYGAHGLDQLLCLTGADIRRLFCELRRVVTLGDADDVVKVLYETKAGVLGELDINMGAALGSYELEVYGTHGAIHLNRGVFKRRWFDPEKLPAKELNRALASRNRAYPSDQIPWQEEELKVDPTLEVDIFADFAHAVRTGKPPFVPPAETVRVTELLERCRADARRILESRG